MKLNLVTFASVFQKKTKEAVRAQHTELFNTLEMYFAVNVLFADAMEEWPEEGLSVAFIATGGTEGMVVRSYDKLPHPLTILTDGKANSLAASLELSNWIRNHGDACTILHGPMEMLVQQLQAMGKRQLMAGKRIGVIGEPSDWLVASDVDYEAARNNWGVEYVDIPLKEVEKRFAEPNESLVKFVAQQFTKNAKRVVEPTHEDILKAARLYLTLQDIAMENRLDALTVQCFSLIPTTGTTGCLALALLNDNGIVAGCEGDLQSIFTMLLIKTITGCDSFMANPAYIDVRNGEIILAHCTIGLKQTEQYTIRSHFESQSGVAVQGILPTGDVTIVKVGGTKLERMAAMEGKLVANLNDPNRCRTQIRVRLDFPEDARYFLTNSIGNHHMVVQGRQAEILKALMEIR